MRCVCILMVAERSVSSRHWQLGTFKDLKFFSLANLSLRCSARTVVNRRQATRLKNQKRKKN